MERVARLEIGQWWADRSTNELGRAGKAVRVEPKAMEVLMALAARAGQVVGREELLAAVWPGVIVGDEALTQSIIKLRRALGDNPRAPTYIETISKRGYRLIAPVRQAGDAPPARRRMPSRALAAGALVALVAAAGYVAHLVARPVATRNMADLMAEHQAAYLTLTVLPFESMGDGGEQAYLARGISNDLMTDLSRLPGLRLIAASRAAPDSAAKARYLVSGSVQRESATLRINIRLIDTASNQQLWSERYERPYRDLFKVQDEITRKLTQVLPGKLSDAVRQSLS